MKTLYRGKRKLNGEWVFGYYVYDEDENHHFIYNNNTGDLERTRVIPETVGIHIHFLTMNEKEIFTGDIVKNEFYGYGVVKVDHINFYVDFGGHEWHMDIGVLHSCTYEGNIHDNKDLIG